MNLLALDTSSVACTVAAKIDEDLFACHEEQPREHTQLLMPMIRSVLLDSGAQLRDLDAIVLGNGPGSFIGMRIAASVAQGLAHGAQISIIPVSSLAAVAAQVFAESDVSEVAVAQDAHMNEVYFGHFSRGQSDLPQPVSDERLQRLEVIAGLDESGSRHRLAAGYGWQRYPELLAKNTAYFQGVSDSFYPQARYLLPLATLDAAMSPQDIDPAYLRREVAKKPRPPQQ